MFCEPSSSFTTYQMYVHYTLQFEHLDYLGRLTGSFLFQKVLPTTHPDVADGYMRQAHRSKSTGLCL